VKKALFLKDTAAAETSERALSETVKLPPTPGVVSQPVTVAEPTASHRRQATHEQRPQRRLGGMGRCVLALLVVVVGVGGTGLALRPSASGLSLGSLYSAQSLRYSLIELKLKLKDYRGAATLLKEASPTAELMSRDQDFCMAVVPPLLAAGEYADALECARGNANLMGDVLRAQHAKQGLQASLASAKKLSPEQRESALLNLSNGLLRAQQYTDLEQVIPLLVNNRSSVSYQLMFAYDTAGNLGQAQALIQREPDEALRKELARKLLDASLEKMDIPALQKLLKTNQTQPSALVQMVIAQRSVGDRPFFIQYLRNTWHQRGKREYLSLLK
jgi:hypothetical protein